MIKFTDAIKFLNTSLLFIKISTHRGTFQMKITVLTIIQILNSTIRWILATMWGYYHKNIGLLREIIEGYWIKKCIEKFIKINDVEVLNHLCPLPYINLMTSGGRVLYWKLPRPPSIKCCWVIKDKIAKITNIKILFINK